MKHTKGEWEIDQTTLYRGEEMIKDEAGKYICGITNRSNQKETEANAKLIAAAPELLEVAIILNDLESLWLPETENISPEHYGELQALSAASDLLKQAIKKATE